MNLSKTGAPRSSSNDEHDGKTFASHKQKYVGSAQKDGGGTGSISVAQ